MQEITLRGGSANEDSSDRKNGFGGGAAILLAGLLAAAPAAQASTGKTVPCKTPALIAAINAANSSGGATINRAPWCTYQLTTASSPNAMLADTGLPVITTPITLNGVHTTIAGNNSTFRILLVTGSGKLTLQGLTITAGNTTGPGGGIVNLEITLVLNHSRVTGNASAGGMMTAGGGIASGTLGTRPAGTSILNFSSVDRNTTTASAGGILNHGGTLILNAWNGSRSTAPEIPAGVASAAMPYAAASATTSVQPVPSTKPPYKTPSGITCQEAKRKPS